MNRIFTMLKTGRVVTEFPWESKTLERPWREGYTRVLIPMTEAEQLRSRRGLKCHTQIVRLSRLQMVKKFMPKKVQRKSGELHAHLNSAS